MCWLKQYIQNPLCFESLLPQRQSCQTTLCSLTKAHETSWGICCCLPCSDSGEGWVLASGTFITAPSNTQAPGPTLQARELPSSSQACLLNAMRHSAWLSKLHLCPAAALAKAPISEMESMKCTPQYIKYGDASVSASQACQQHSLADVNCVYLTTKFQV